MEGYNKSTDPQWHQLVFDSNFLSKLDHLTSKRFGNAALAEECTTFVLDALSKDNWARCKKYQGLSKPTTYLYSITTHLLEEFSRSKFGRPRPPSWLSQRGDLWVSLWRWMCLEKQMVPTIIDRCEVKGYDVEQVKHATSVIKAKIPNCCQLGANPIVEVSDDIDITTFAEDESSNEKDNRFNFERQTGNLFYSMLQSIMSDADEISASDESDIPEMSQDQLYKLQEIKAGLRLTDQEKILIRMVYVDGLSKTKAARALNLPDHQGGKIINSTLSRVKSVFDNLNLDVESLYHSIN